MNANLFLGTLNITYIETEMLFFLSFY